MNLEELNRQVNSYLTTSIFWTGFKRSQNKDGRVYSQIVGSCREGMVRYEDFNLKDSQLKSATPETMASTILMLARNL